MKIMTATDILKRREEARIQSDKDMLPIREKVFKPLIERTKAIMARKGIKFEDTP